MFISYLLGTTPPLKYTSCHIITSITNFNCDGMTACDVLVSPEQSFSCWYLPYSLITKVRCSRGMNRCILSQPCSLLMCLSLHQFLVIYIIRMRAHPLMQEKLLSYFQVASQMVPSHLPPSKLTDLTRIQRPQKRMVY